MTQDIELILRTRPNTTEYFALPNLHAGSLSMPILCTSCRTQRTNARRVSQVVFTGEVWHLVAKLHEALK